MPRHTSKHDSASSQIYSTQYSSSAQYLSDSSQSGGHSPQSPTAPSSLSQSSQSSAAANGKKKHVCPTCDRGFTTSGHLARHLRVHTGERNHKCPFPGCETRCSRQDNLQQHYRIHLSPGSRRSSSSATRAAIARAVGISGSGTKNSRTASSLMSSDHNSSDTPSPPPALEHAIPPAPDSPPPLVQAFSVPSYSDSLHSGSVSSRSPTPPDNSFPMINQHSQSMSNGQVASHSSPIQSHYGDNTPSYDESSQANYGYVSAGVSQTSSGHAVHDHSYDYSQAYGEKPSMSRIHSSSLHQSPMENVHDGSPQSSAHLSSVSSRLSISHISHPHSYPTQYQAVSTPSPESPHSVSPHSQISTPNYSAYRDDSHEVASYQNGSGILDPVSDHSNISSSYMNTQNNVVHGSYGHSLMSHHSSIPRYDSPPPVLAPIQDERVLRGDIRIPQMHHSITPPASLSYIHHSQVPSSYPYHAPHVGLGQSAWKADNVLRARPSTGYV
ncbi:hypothetical protein BDR06DRAFT_911880 [Suillus hirtellus]|nr:hypothetical protein BDR06DRAFT_911880 [Suillus hirtellus]